MERSTDQVIKAINKDALSKWVGKLPQDVVDDMAQIAPMLSILGYDDKKNPPDYEKDDLKVNYDELKNYPFNDKTEKDY